MGRLDLREFDPQAESLATWLGNIPNQARGFRFQGAQFVERRDYLIPCNWKVYVDNYLDGYHIPIAHPGLMREIDYTQYRTVLAAANVFLDAFDQSFVPQSYATLVVIELHVVNEECAELFEVASVIGIEDGCVEGGNGFVEVRLRLDVLDRGNGWDRAA